MITLLKSGPYRLIETKKQTKILILGEKDTYAWINATGIGELLVTSHRTFEVDNILVIGNFRLYEVMDEPNLTDLFHLELSVGNGLWQGYLLPIGLPTDDKKKSRVIPTEEKITISTI